jgi:hypothetical protein
MIYALATLVVICFVIEVLLGSGRGVHDAELGIPSRIDRLDKMTINEFARQYLPFLLLIYAGLYLAHCVVSAG